MKIKYYLPFFHLCIFIVSQAILGIPISNTITQKGVYNFRANIIKNPILPNESIICIDASNVIVDLEGYCLTQDLINTITGLIGIEIAANVENVIVRNGTIASLTGNGIKINDGATGISLENLVISGCHEGGIFLDGSSTGTGIEKVSITNCLVLSSTGAGGGPAYGLHMRKTKNFRLHKCRFLDNDALTTNSGFGCLIDNSQVGNIIDCSMENNGGDVLGIGCLIQSCTVIMLKNNMSTQNRCRSSSSAAFSAGFATKFSNGIVFTDCESGQNLSDLQAAFGFSLENGGGNFLKHCITGGNNGSGVIAGIRFSAQTNSVINQCISNASFSFTGTAYGIFFEGSSNDHCYVAENEIVNNSGVTSRGIVDSRSPSTSFFQKNNAFNNGTNYVISYPLTITLPLITGSLSSAVPGLPGLLAGELDNVDVNP